MLIAGTRSQRPQPGQGAFDQGFLFLGDISLMLDLWYKGRLHMGPYPVLDDPIAVINSRYFDNVCFNKSSSSYC